MFKSKNILTVLFVFLTILVLQVSAYGSELKNKNEIKGFEIVSGCNIDEKEVTFDISRTITGNAPKGTTITITVSQLNPDYEEGIEKYDKEGVLISKYLVSETHTINVGNFRFFSQDVSLENGENYINIVGENKTDSCEYNLIIDRMNIEIKKELEKKKILLPGSINVVTRAK